MRNSFKLLSFAALSFIILSFTFQESKNITHEINANKSITIWPYCKGGICTATKQGTHTPIYLYYHSAADAWYTNTGALENVVYDIYVCCGSDYGSTVIDLTSQNHGQDTVVLITGASLCSEK